MLSYLIDFISLFYPRWCKCCKRTLACGEEYICLYCLASLAETDFHTYKDNPLEMVFAGRVAISRAAAYCFFRKGGTIQAIVHELKYNGCKKVGSYLGYLFGLTLREYEDFNSVDVIIPIPLHKKKLKKRGYNQSYYIAKGIAEAMSKQVNATSLIRIIDTATQTKKSRYDRWENVSNIFQITDHEELKDKHILLVDDIVTTGSTIESAAQQLLSISGTKVSIACLGYAGA